MRLAAPLSALCIGSPLAALGPTVQSPADWSVPNRFHGKIITNRVRGFTERIVALTFDDGPNAKVTTPILDALRRHDARATFFVVGEMATRNQTLMRRMVAEGHVIGNHSWSHPYRLSAQRAVRELEQTDKLILSAVGQKPTCYRPPGGFTKNELTKLAIKQGRPVFIWSVCSADTTKIGTSGIIRNVTRTPGPGDIVLMHDGPGHKTTAQAVPAILKELDRLGLKCVTLPELCRAWDRWLTSKGAATGLQAPKPARKKKTTSSGAAARPKPPSRSGSRPTHR